MSDDFRTDPKPDDAELDHGLLPQLVGDAMIAADPDCADEIGRALVLGEFGYLLDEFDDFGIATVEVISNRDGRVAGWVRVHWSQIAA